MPGCFDKLSFALASFALVGLGSFHGAHAADMQSPRIVQPVTYAPQSPPPQISWDGCYAGLHGGGQLAKVNYDTVSTTPNALPIYKVSTHNDTFTSALVGAQIGCNKIVSHLLVGFEFDVWYAPGPFDERCRTQIDPILDCVRIRERPAVSGAGRFGFVHSSVLFYGKAGVAYLNTDFESRYHRTKIKGNTPTIGAPFQYEEKHTRAGLLSQAGLLLGFGVEYAINETWSTKLEYNNIITAEKEFKSVIATGGVLCTDGTSCNAGYTDTSGLAAKQVVSRQVV
jgi:opacity protein-like surface antigen